MRRAVTILLLFMLVSCYNTADKPFISGDLPMATSTVHSLKSTIMGTQPTQIKGDVIIVGHVVSSDRDDNFYRTIVVDDGSGAIEVMVGTSPLEAIYPEGLRVALLLKECYAGYSRGVLQVGRRAPSYESYAIDYLSSRENIDKVIKRSCDVDIIEPRCLAIDELSKDDCGRLCRIDGLRVANSTSIDTLQGDVLDDARWRGYALFRNDDGDSIATYTSDYARFAEHHIPNDEVSIVGIVQWAKYNGGKECFQLKLRYEEDCMAR